MDIGALSMSMSAQSLSNQVGIALARKTMDVATDNSQELIKMMELSVNPNLGSNLDFRV